MTEALLWVAAGSGVACVGIGTWLCLVARVTYHMVNSERTAMQERIIALEAAAIKVEAAAEQAKKVADTIRVKAGA